MTSQRWKRIRKASNDLFVAPGGKASLLIYRSNQAPLKVKLSEIKPLIDALAAAADDLTTSRAPGPTILPPDR